MSTVSGIATKSGALSMPVHEAHKQKKKNGAFIYK